MNVGLFIKSKIQFFESKSQQENANNYIHPCCLSSQRYNFLKANHNFICFSIMWCTLFIKSKIQFFESKSQPEKIHEISIQGCLSSQRYNFLKANHNLKIPTIIVIALFIKSKIQFFESKSQPTAQTFNVSGSCLSSQRYNFLKANHNNSTKITIFLKLFIKSKIQFFESKSQLLLKSNLFFPCCLSSQRYNFLKANHNRQRSVP